MRSSGVVLVVGTRPEAIKLAPVHQRMTESERLSPILVSTGQHRELLETALRPLRLEPDHLLDVMVPNQTPNDVVRRVVERLSELLAKLSPGALLVQGDTTSAMAATLTAYHMRIPVGHVEAGLRTYDHEHPFPEEANRQITDRLARWLFAPTDAARDNLLAERLDPSCVFVTGNTVVDSLLWAIDRSPYRCPENSVLVTLHRRESFGTPLREILLGLGDFLEAVPDAHAIWPVHPNPNVARAIAELSVLKDRIERVEPMDYVTFAGALVSCRFVLTDSGGLQEEGPSLGKTVLVARETTERPEGLRGRNRLVGRTRARVREALLEAWSEPPYTGVLPAPNPFGDGKAGERIVSILEEGIGE